MQKSFNYVSKIFSFNYSLSTFSSDGDDFEMSKSTHFEIKYAISSDIKEDGIFVSDGKISVFYAENKEVCTVPSGLISTLIDLDSIRKIYQILISQVDNREKQGAFLEFFEAYSGIESSIVAHYSKEKEELKIFIPLDLQVYASEIIQMILSQAKTLL